MALIGLSNMHASMSIGVKDLFTTTIDMHHPSKDDISEFLSQGFKTFPHSLSLVKVTTKKLTQSEKNFRKTCQHTRKNFDRTSKDIKTKFSTEIRKTFASLTKLSKDHRCCCIDVDWSMGFQWSFEELSKVFESFKTFSDWGYNVHTFRGLFLFLGRLLSNYSWIKFRILDLVPNKWLVSCRAAKADRKSWNEIVRRRWRVRQLQRKICRASSSLLPSLSASPNKFWMRQKKKTIETIMKIGQNNRHLSNHRFPTKL